MAEFYSLVILLINLSEEIGESNFQVYCSRWGGGGGENKPLNAHTCSSLHHF